LKEIKKLFGKVVYVVVIEIVEELSVMQFKVKPVVIGTQLYEFPIITYCGNVKYILSPE
jgi:hypothetical protein